jgi:DNA-binding beta-propeller fold protein YncE
MKKIAIVVALISLCGYPAASQAVPLTLRQTIPLPGVMGKFDHFAFDAAGGRLFAAATGSHSVEVIDLATGKVQQSIGGLGKPHGLVWITSTQKLYIADGSQAALLVYHEAEDSHFKPAGKLGLSDDADDMVYNEANHLLFVGHGGSNAANPARIAVVDTANFTLVNNLAVATHPEALEIDERGQRIFANIADSNEVAVMDGSGRAVAAKWKLERAADNVPLAYDEAHHSLYVACRNPASIVVLDAVSGKEMSSLPTTGGADDLFYDRALSRVYVIGGAGEVDAYQVKPDRSLEALGVLHTAIGAKTALFVPSQSSLYVGIPGADGHSAEIRVYATSAKRGAE